MSRFSTSPTHRRSARCRRRWLRSSPASAASMTSSSAASGPRPTPRSSPSTRRGLPRWSASTSAPTSATSSWRWPRRRLRSRVGRARPRLTALPCSLALPASSASANLNSARGSLTRSARTGPRRTPTSARPSTSWSSTRAKRCAWTLPPRRSNFPESATSCVTFPWAWER